jgi:tetratricopeptide (TPR) repeat protein
MSPASASGPGPFVGREAERALLQASLDDARHGHGRLVLVGGEPGIGKSRLLEQLGADAAAAGVATHVGQCDAMDGAPDLWPWRQVLRAFAAADPAAGAGPPPLGGGDGEATRFQQADAVVGWLAARTRAAPAVLVFEDVHWADRASLALLEFLAAHVARLSLLVVATHRLEAVVPGRPLYAALAEITRRAATRRVTLHGLARDAVHDYVAASGGRAPSPAAVDALLRQTGGNPFFVAETIRWLVEQRRLDLLQAEGVDSLPVPPTVREVVASRVAQLPAAVGDTLARAAVVGPDFALPLLAAAAGTDPAAVLGALDVAVAAGLVVESGPGGYRFAHAVVRDVVYAGLPSAVRLAHHRDLARLLEERDDRDQHLAEIAHHTLAAAPLGLADRAVEAATRAALHAKARGVWDESARHWQQALAAFDLLPSKDPRRRAELLLGLGTARKRAGDAREATIAFLAAADVARTLGDRDLLVRAAMRDGMWFRLTDATLEARVLEVLEEAAAALGDTRSAHAARILTSLAVGCYDYGRIARARELGARGLAMARGLERPDVVAWCLIGGAWVLVPTAQDRRLAYAEEVVALGDRLGRPMVQCVGYELLASTRLQGGNAPAAYEAIQACHRLAERLGDPHHLWLSTGLLVTRALLEGDARAADALIDTSAEHGRRAFGPLATETVLVQRLTLFAQEGRVDAAREMIEGARRLQPLNPIFRAVHAYFLAEQGDAYAAHAELQALAANDFAALLHDGYWLVSMTCLAFVFRSDVRDAAIAEALHDRLLPHAGETITLGNGRICVGAVAWALGALAASLERWDDAERHYDATLRLHRAMGARPFLARALVDYAAALRRRGHPADRDRIRLLLDEAERLGRELGMQAVLALSVLVRGDESGAGVAVPPPRGSTFRRDGEMWTVTHAGHLLHLKDAKGLHYLAHLLRHPGRDVHVLDLVAVATRSDDADAKRYLKTADAGEVLDGRARAAYGARLAELREDLDEAERFADRGRMERTRGEIEFLTEQLASAVGLGGRERRTGRASERARAAVTQTIRGTLRKIADAIPSLGPALGDRIRTGTYCRYDPPADARIDWVL